MSSANQPPPLAEAEVCAAERELGISFPAEYREYLLCVSAGGRFAHLEQSEGGWWWADNSVQRRALLTEPFPHPDSYADADRALEEREPRREDFADDESFYTAWRAWDAECAVAEEHKAAGAIVIEEHGCGFATLLAITGPLAGTFWWDGRATCGEILPLSRDHVGGGRSVCLDEWILYGSWNLLPPGWG